MHASDFEGWAGSTCVVTGGLGFIGSNLVRALSSAGARVRVVDALIPEHGGRVDQLDGIAIDELLVAAVDDRRVAELLAGADLVFNLAGQVSHTASMRDPLTDLQCNTISHAGLLEMIRAVRPGARVVYASTRQVYGRAGGGAVDERVTPVPVDVNGVAKLAGEQLHMVYAHAHAMPITALRLTNVYGPAQRLTSDELGFLPVFLRKALRDETIQIYGDGMQQRDCLHVADVVRAFALATADSAVARVLNVGHPDTHSLGEIAALIVEATGSRGGVELVPWPGEQARIDVGSVHVVSDLIAGLVGWEASVALADGIADTVRFYRAHPEYLEQR